MKRKRRIILAFGILICILAGCGKPQTPEIPPISSGQTAGEAAESENGPLEENAVSWQADYLQLEHSYDMAVTAGDIIYGCLLGEEGARIDWIGKENASSSAALTLPGISEVLGLAADRDGNVYLLENKDGDMGFWKADGDSGATERVEMELENCEEISDLSLKGIATDHRDYFYIWCEMMIPEMEMGPSGEREVWHFVDRVYVKNGELETLFFEEIDDMGGTQVLDFQIGTEGTPFFIVKDREGIYVQEIDVEQKDLKEAVRLAGAADSFDADSAVWPAHLVSTDKGFLYCLGSELLEFHYDTQKTERILDLNTYGIFSSDIVYLAKHGDEIEIIDNHEGTGNSEFISLTLGTAQKQTVTLGTTMVFQDLERVAGEFNRSNSEYRVEIINYENQAGSYEDGIERLKLEVVTGNAPDVIVVSEIDYRMFSEKGVLADLYDFMREDGECAPDMLVPAVISAWEDEGHLYSVAPAFQLHSMWGYGDVIDGRKGIGFSELAQMLEACKKDANAITGFSADEPVLTRLCTLFMNAFVDWENGTCDFEGQYFKEVLSFAKEYAGSGGGAPVSEQIRRREAVLSVGIISSVTDYQIQRELYGKDIAFVGYPVTEGTGTAAAFYGSAVAINAKNENSAGAWEFVKYYLLHGYDGQGLPIIQEQFDQAMKEAMEDQIVMDNGEEELFPKGYYDDGGGSIAVYAAVQEEVEAVIGLVEDVENRFEMHPAIQKIIDEEAEAYFAGQVDLESTAQKIQNRVGLLLLETQG